jgi:MYXO-CTERM domain-containing protein
MLPRMIAGLLLPLLVAGHPHLREYVVDNADGTSRTGYTLDFSSPRVPLVEPTPHNPKVAFVLLNFDGVQPQSRTVASVESILAEVREYYLELSYGSWTVDYDVFGPYSVTKPGNCDLDTITDLARDAAAAQGVPIDTFVHIGVTLPDNDDSGLGCACGLAWVGRSPAQPDPEVQHGSLYTCVESNAFAHELGHGFGLHHASKAHCDGQAMRRDPYGACDVEEYGNQFNVMGNGLGHMNAFQKGTMGWLDKCNIVKVGRDATYHLRAIPLASDEVQALQIATGDTRDGNALYYYVEYRNPALAEFNAGGSQPREKGAGLHVGVAPDVVVDNGDRRPLILDVSENVGDFEDPRLTPGRSFTDPDGRVTITLVSVTEEVAEVQVTFPGGGTGVDVCRDGSTPPDDNEPPPDAGVGPDADGSGGDDTGDNAGGDDVGNVTSGCGCRSGTSDTTGGMLLFAVGSALLVRRRRRC